MTDLCVQDHGDDDRRALPSLRLCSSHRDGLERDLERLPRLWHDLGTALSSPTITTTVSNGPRASRDDDRDPLVLAETSLPINPAMADHRDQIKHDLVWWCLFVADHRGLGLPGDTVAEIAAWLGRHVDWIAATLPAAEECPPVMRGLTGRAHALVQPSGARRIEIGPCRGSVDGEPCPGRLWATVRREDDPAPSVIYCDGCHAEIPPESWRRFGHDYLRIGA